MNNKLEGLLSLVNGESVILQSLGVVSNGLDNTSLGRTVFGVDDLAGLGRRSIVAVNEVVAATEASLGSVAEGISPECDVSKIGSSSVVEEGLNGFDGTGEEVLLSEKGDRLVSEGSPGVCTTSKEGERKDDS